MMPTISCKTCGTKISIDEALLSEIKEEALQEVSKDHLQQLEVVRKEVEQAAEMKYKRAAKEQEERHIKELNQKFDEKLKDMEEEKEKDKKENSELRDQLKQTLQTLRVTEKAKNDAVLEMEKQLLEEEKKIRQQAEKVADEKQRLIIEEYKKKLSDTEKSLAEAQRKANQGSMQTQGEVLELDLERSLVSEFPDDEIVPIPKGKNGADVCQIVRSAGGRECGKILWESKRTKNWSEEWIDKLKEDCRNAKAHLAVLITEALPKDLEKDFGIRQGVYVTKPSLALLVAQLLRKNLLDVERQKSMAEDRGTKADALYSFVTSHEFAHQIESMVETYVEMREQVQKERAAFEKLWAQREKQAQRLLRGTAHIIGAMQGQIGHSAMPRIKGLELMELPESS